jgi:hypothetical protein
MSLAKPGNEQSVSGRSRAGAAVVAMMLALSHILIFQATASAAHEIRVPMGTLTNFSVLAHSLITDTGGTSTFADGVGVWPGSSVVGISDGDQASGGIHLGDALAEQAQSDFSLAYAYAAAQIPEVIAAELGGQILGAGVYGPAGGGTALSLGTTLTLDAEGDKNAIFIVQTAGAFNSTATTGAIALINGAQACNVFFQVGGAVTLGAASSFSGTMLAQGAITVGAGVDFYGRGFTGQGDMTLSDNVFYEPTCDGTTVTPTHGLITTEAGSAATFTVVLNSQPSADVAIEVSSSDTTEGTVDNSVLTFTQLNWATPQTVTVTGVDDPIVDGDVAFWVVLAPAIGGGYGGTDPADVSVTNTDNDALGVTVTPPAGLVTTEAGGTDAFTVKLDSQPSADVTIGVSSSDTTEGTTSVSSVTFSTLNWSVPQTVTVTGVNDAVDDGDVAYSVVLMAATGGEYAGIDPADVSVTNTDNDPIGITVFPTSGLATTEAGGVATFTVVLDSQPSADVTIGVSSSDTTEGTASPPLLVFTTQNWATQQTVTVTGVDDSVVDGDVAYTLLLAIATGGDYAGTDPADVTMSNIDDDTVGVTVTPVAGLVTTEAGGIATFTVKLDSQPSAEVSIGVSSSDTTEGTTSVSSLVFTAQNWTTPQTVTVTGVDDSIVDGDVGYFVALAGAVGGGYDAVDPTDVSVINTDDDTSGGDEVVPPPTGLVDTSAACPASIATSGFGDLSGLEATTIQAIDCLAQYGISNGTSSLTFTPDGTVTRWQMALFLIRQVQVHGVVLPMAVDQGFVDLDGHNQETHDAIDQLAQLGITRGTGSRTFSPDEAVSRWEMALFLVRFLDAAGVSIPTLSTAGPFDDLAQMDIETTTAIDQLAALGVAAGTGTTTFEPSNAVLRWHMALFLTRVMALDGIVPS